MKRLTAEKFVEAIKFAPEFVLHTNTELQELELVVIETDGTTHNYLGPHLMLVGHREYSIFLNQLDEVAKFEELRQKMWEIY